MRLAGSKAIASEPPPLPPITREEDMRFHVRRLFNRYDREPTKKQMEAVLHFLSGRGRGRPKGSRSRQFRTRNAKQVSKQYERLELLAAVEIGRKRGWGKPGTVCGRLYKLRPFGSAVSASALAKEYARARKAYGRLGHSPMALALHIESDVALAVAHFPSLRTIYGAV